METSTIIIVVIIGLLLYAGIMYLLYRWIFAIKRQLWNQKAQINLLIMIAEKLGVPHDSVDIIQRRNNEKSDMFLDDE